MAKEKAKAEYSRPTSQEDLETRLKDDYVPSSQLAGSTDVSPLDRGGFVGVDPVYQNAANEIDRPMQAKDGPEAELMRRAGQEGNVWKGDEAVPDVPTHAEMVAEDEERKREEYEERKAAAEEKGEPVGAPPAPATEPQGTSTVEGDKTASAVAPTQPDSTSKPSS